MIDSILKSITTTSPPSFDTPDHVRARINTQLAWSEHTFTIDQIIKVMCSKTKRMNTELYTDVQFEACRTISPSDAKVLLSKAEEFFSPYWILTLLSYNPWCKGLKGFTANVRISPSK